MQISMRSLSAVGSHACERDGNWLPSFFAMTGVRTVTTRSDRALHLKAHGALTSVRKGSGGSNPKPYLMRMFRSGRTLKRQFLSRRRRVPRDSTVVAFAFAVLAVLSRPVEAQAPGGTGSTPWAVWGFGRFGVAETSQLNIHGSAGASLPSVAGGVGASRGPIVGLIRASTAMRGVFSDVPTTGLQDLAALAGMRSQAEHLVVVAAAGVAEARQTGEPSIGSPNPTQAALAYDLSAHATSHMAALALAFSGVVGPARVRYAALSLEVDFGRFSSR